METEYTEGRPHIFIKCMERKYIDKMFKHGEMRFSCPAKWVKAELENGLGQGDKFETKR